MNTPYVFKKCTKCGKLLVANKVNFNKCKAGKYGLRSWCKECDKKYKKTHYEENKEKITKRQKKYREENKEYYNQYNKNYYEENKESYKKYYEKHKEYNKNYYKENKEYYKKYYKVNKVHIKDCRKKYYQTAQGQIVRFNNNNKRRQKEVQQGNGITKDQWLEMMKFFEWKCAYSGKSVNSKNNRSIDHIVPLVKGGEHEIWNCVPMDRSLNSSKQDKDINEWYPQQDFYDEDRLNKINEWQEYAYDKWGKDELKKIKKSILYV